MPDARQPRTIVHHTVIAAMSALASMTLFEFLKTLLLPSLTLWESHLITIAVTTVIAASGAFLVLRKLRQNEDSYRRLVELSPDAVLVYRHGAIIFANNACADFLGASSSGDLIGKLYLDFAHASERESVRRRMEQFHDDLQSVRRREAKFVRLDGIERYAEVMARSILYRGEVAVQVVFRDVSQRKQSEEHLRRLAQAVENSRELIGMGDPESRITFGNRAFLQSLGYSDQELIGMSWSVVFSPSNRPGLEDEMRRAIFERGGWKGECLQRRKDGTDLPVFLSVGLLTDSEGSVTGTMGIAQDITERKKLEEQFRQAQKMEAVGRLSGGIAHDFNNLLGVIIGYSEIIEEGLGQDTKLRRNAREIKKAGQRAASLTRQLLAFSRQQVLEPKVLTLNAIVADTEKMLRRLIGEDIELTTSLAPGLGHVKADQGQIEQIILNLAVNARDAMPDGGKLIIETGNITLNDEYTLRHPPTIPGDYVMLVVTDTGIGMDTQTQTHIFEPFFTTKELGKGTGLGLSTVYGVVKQSGGYIWVYSELGLGSTFKIYLPQVDEPVQQSLSTDIATGSLRGSETVLLVEDEPSLRSLTRTLLEQSGYTILEANGGGEATEIARLHPGPIHLLLTDMVMPGINGRALAEGLRAMRPDMSVIFMSGYMAFTAHGLLDSEANFLPKPIARDALLRKLRDVLNLQREPTHP